jgi:hypothetical protein
VGYFPARRWVQLDQAVEVFAIPIRVVAGDVGQRQHPETIKSDMVGRWTYHGKKSIAVNLIAWPTLCRSFLEFRNHVFLPTKCAGLLLLVEEDEVRPNNFLYLP